MFIQLVLPEYLIHVFFCVMFLCAAEWLTLGLNMPLLAYHVWRYVQGVLFVTLSNVHMLLFSLSENSKTLSLKTF